MVVLWGNCTPPKSCSTLNKLDGHLPLLLLMRAMLCRKDVYLAETSNLIPKEGNMNCIGWCKLQKSIIPQKDNTPGTTHNNASSRRSNTRRQDEQSSINYCHQPCIAAVNADILVSCCPIGLNGRTKDSTRHPSSTDTIRVTRFMGDHKGMTTC